jgi:hypothetical protein
VKIREALRLWAGAVEEYVRLHTQAVLVKNRTLYVHADSSALASELSLRERELLDRLNRALKVRLLERIIFKAGRVAHEEHGAAPADGAKIRLTADTVKRIDATVKDIEEDELRDILRRFLRTAAGRKRSKR